MHITATEERCKFCTLAEENKTLRAAFNAAYAYIHNSQDNGAESQARYTAWIEARKKVDQWR